MNDATQSCGPEVAALMAENVRLNKIIKALMDRAERSANSQTSDFGIFQRTIMLEDQVRRRTAELEASLRENERINRALRESETKFRGLVSQSLVGIAIIADSRFSYANSKFAEMFGYRVDELMGLPLPDIATKDDRPLVEEQMRRRLSGEVDRVDYVFRGRRKNGVGIDVECHSSVMEIDGRLALIDLVLDITERTQAEREVRTLHDQLREQAIHDPLTGLYNRQHLNEFFDREVKLAERRHHSIGVVIADLDHFKAVNDTYGHLAGDEVLKTVGRLIKNSYRASDIHCRYGGEEFLIVLPDMEGGLAFERTERLRVAIENTHIQFAAALIPVTASFGLATYPEHGENRDTLIAAADCALYAAKSGGRNQVRCYTQRGTSKALEAGAP